MCFFVKEMVPSAMKQQRSAVFLAATHLPPPAADPVQLHHATQWMPTEWLGASEHKWSAEGPNHGIFCSRAKTHHFTVVLELLS